MGIVTGVTGDAMIYPNIQLLDKNKSFYLSDEHSSFINHKKYEFLHHSAEEDLFVILSQPIKNIKPVIDYIKNSNYNNYKFIIDDVFRLTFFENFSLQDTTELNIIQNIISESNIKNYEIYHCEKFDNINYDNLFFKELKYLDLFLIDYCMNDFYNKFSKTNSNFLYKISCLNNRIDFHRFYISSLLVDKSDIFLTFNDFDEQKTFDDLVWFLDNPQMNIHSFSDKIQKSIIKNSNTMIELYGKNKIISSKKQHNHTVSYLIRNSFVNLITETTYFHPQTYISEKSIKPIHALRPFIMLGPRGNLAHLKEFGFKTFDKWWDESYDNEPDNHKRLEMVFELCKLILNKSNEELKDMLIDMESVLIHNKKQIKKFSYEYFTELHL